MIAKGEGQLLGVTITSVEKNRDSLYGAPVAWLQLNRCTAELVLKMKT